MKFENPILRGFYPDPSICVAGDKYYMVCSSFPANVLQESAESPFVHVGEVERVDRRST